VAVSHDRAFLRQMDRFLMVLHDGSVVPYLGFEQMMEALVRVSP
jgi:ATPase subunit of ABC transporter with duplicated ATPase domains